MDRVRVNNSVIEAANNPRDAETQDSKKDWEKDYIKAFKDECFKICEEIRTAFRELGCPVGEDGVCIKHYNPERRTLDVVKRDGPHHMHLVAGVADSLYPLMVIYKRALDKCGKS